MKFTIDGLDEVLRSLENEGGDKLARRTDAALKAGAKAMAETGWIPTAKKYGFIDTGDMIGSIEPAGDVIRYRDSCSVEIYPQGKDRRGARNMTKAAILHYGTSGGQSLRRRKNKKNNVPGIPTTYWVDEAEREGEVAATVAMQEEFFKEE